MNNIKKITLNNNLLEDIAMAMNDNSFEQKWYLDIRDEVVVLDSDYNEDEQLHESIENEYGERYISVPVKDSREGWEQMEKFIESLSDQNQLTRDLLLSAIGGKGAFGRFKNAIYHSGLNERWYEFKGREDRQEALVWLHSIELIADGDIEKGIQLYDEWLSKRKQKEKDVADMIKGTSVKCIYNDGHTDKLTPGVTYKVLDERKEQLQIRIKDDRGKECWLPKSHFELLHL